MWTKEECEAWVAAVREKRSAIHKEKDKEFTKMKGKREERRKNFFVKDSLYNSKYFCRVRESSSKDPDGEVVYNAVGRMITEPVTMTDRYGEYYGDMLKGTLEYKWPPNKEHCKEWMHEPTMAKNKEKLEAALFRVSMQPYCRQ